MTAEERKRKIENYGVAYDILSEGIKAFPREMWHFKPSPEFWSIHEIIIHVTDSEANSYIRARRFVAEPGQTLMSYDENGWGKTLNYADQNADDALELFRWLRGNTYRLIKDLPDAVWSNEAFHPDNGSMSLDDWLNTYERHVPDHLQQMTEVYDQWQARPV